jgi:predicted alpha/beta superfamily hydrolase
MALALGSVTAISGIAPVIADPYALPGTSVEEISTETGADYRIYIHQPDAKAPAAGYPVLYLLDGDDHFATAVTTATRFETFSRSTGVEAGLIVAIAYPGPSRRSLDFTPPTGNDSDAYGNPVGGADRFRDFIRNQLKPMIAARYPVDPEREAIFGHSYGGLFVLETLVQDPSLFDTYVAASPSIWYADRILFEHLADAGDDLTSAAPRKVVMTVGELEQPPLPETEDEDVLEKAALLNSRRLVDDNIGFAAMLESVPGLSVDQRVLTGETHGTSPLPTLGWAIMSAFAEVSP